MASNSVAHNAIASNPLAALEAFPQFIVYRLQPRAGSLGKSDKIPVHPVSGVPTDKSAPGMWMSRLDAEQAAARLGQSHGVGFVLTDATGLFCLDIDGCLQADSRTWSPLALNLCAMFPGAAVEVSVSGKGLHIWGKGQVPAHACKNAEHGIELYTADRFIALGSGAAGDAGTDHTVMLAAVVACFFPPGPVAANDPAHAEWTDGPCEGWVGPDDDQQLIKLMLNSARPISAAEAFGGGRPTATFRQLWEADEAALAAVFPSGSADAYDRSAADFALALQLAYWTGRDCARIERLMRWSSLAARAKWDRPDYLRDRCILPAVAKRVADPVLGQRREDPRRAAQLEEARRIGADLGDAGMPEILTVGQMVDELVYVTQGSRVVHRRSRKLLPYTDAVRAYAASVETWVDPNGKPKQRPAMPAWLAHQARVQVDTVTWHPGAPEFCEPAESRAGADRALNTWRGIKHRAAPANWRQWVQPFVDHVTYLVPEAGERHRFMQWLGHILQRPGELPHTGYLMMTPTTGTGRNWLAAVLARVLRGHAAVGVQLAPLLDGKFNGVLSEKLLATVDETREGMSDRRHVRGEALKQLITAEVRHIDAKYGMQTAEVNCCRWLMFSNHEDALPFYANDRRIIVVANPTERRAPEVYTRLYSLLGFPEFIASVQHLLATLSLEGFNAGEPAPMNAAKERALESMSNGVDEAIADFVKDWPSAFATVDDLHTHVLHATDVDVKPDALKHAMRRAGIPKATPVKLRGQTKRAISLRGHSALPAVIVAEILKGQSLQLQQP